jgi:hypothetical protein
LKVTSSIDVVDEQKTPPAWFQQSQGVVGSGTLALETGAFIR